MGLRDFFGSLRDGRNKNRHTDGGRSASKSPVKFTAKSGRPSAPGKNNRSGSKEVGANRYQKEATPRKWGKILGLGFLKGKAGLVLQLLTGASLTIAFFFGTGILLVYGYNFFITSEYFSIKTIEIRGNNRLNSREVLEIIDLSLGKNALSVSMPAMEAALARNPWVSGLSIKRTLPDRFDIVITERDPRYWVNRGGDLYYADEIGRTIMRVTLGGGFASLPELQIEPGAESLGQRLPELVKSLNLADLPLDITASSRLKLAAGGWLELKPTDSLSVVIGLDNWDLNLRHLGRVLDDLARRGELRGTAEIRAHGSNVWVSRRPSGQTM